MGTVRLFMAPVNDETGKPLSFDEQRRLMVEMDKFTHASQYTHDDIICSLNVHT